MLSYIDQTEIRSQVYRSLSSNKIPGRNEIELEIHNQCTRLIANCIIFYNASILSCLYEGYRGVGDEENCALIKRLSPVAWQHINLVGRYEFYQEGKIIDLQEIIQTLLDSRKINFLLQRKG